MRCPACLNKLKVVDSRHTHNLCRRKRVCYDCNLMWSTVEQLDEHGCLPLNLSSKKDPMPVTLEVELSKKDIEGL